MNSIHMRFKVDQFIPKTYLFEVVFIFDNGEHFTSVIVNFVWPEFCTSWTYGISGLFFISNLKHVDLMWTGYWDHAIWHFYWTFLRRIFVCSFERSVQYAEHGQLSWVCCELAIDNVRFDALEFPFGFFKVQVYMVSKGLQTIFTTLCIRH